MKVGFVCQGAEYLGVEYLSAYLKAHGHEVQLFFDPAVYGGQTGLDIPALAERLDLSERIVEEVLKAAPDLLGFSVLTMNYHWALGIAQKVKARCASEKRRPPAIIFGGIHPSSVPDRVIREECVDMLLVGEGEEALLELAELWAQGRRPYEIRNIWFKEDGRIIANPVRPYIRDLDALPFADRALFYDKVPLLERRYLLLTGRGCPFSCSYCCNNVLHKIYECERQHIRRRSVENVLVELDLVKKRGIAKSVFIVDDIFALDEDWLEEFARHYPRRIGIPFHCFVHPMVVNERRVALLKQAGCTYITMGIQSASERTRHEVLNRPESNARILRAAELIREAQIPLSLDHILGLPGEGEAEQLEAAELYARIKPKRILTFWLTYFPCTDIVEIARQKGQLAAADVERIESGLRSPEGRQDFWLAGGSVPRAERKIFASFATLFALIPLLPRKVAAFLIQKRRYRFVPRIYAFYFLVQLVVAIVHRVPNLYMQLRYPFCKKDVP